MTEPEAEPVPVPRPAATLVVLRESADGPPDLLLLERARSMKFAGGALVFPGGSIDPGDYALAQDLALELGLELDDAAARVAAIRETLEESGLAVGLSPIPDSAALAALRGAMAAGSDFGTLLAQAGLSLDLGALVPFARWLPPGRIGVPRFDTRFYLARADADAQASVDETENVRLTWSSAAGALASSAMIIFPTRRNLERLAQFADYAAACADAALYPIDIITPWMEDRDGAPHLCIPAGRGYPVTAQLLADVMRG